MTKRVNVCAVPFDMTIVDGGVLFSNKSGFHGHWARFSWVYRSHLWYLIDSQTTYDKVAGCVVPTAQCQLRTKRTGATISI